MEQPIYNVIFCTSNNPLFFESGLTAKEIEFCCQAYLEKGEWVEAIVIETGYKIVYEME